jgi:hypothetical protein
MVQSLLSKQMSHIEQGVGHFCGAITKWSSKFGQFDHINASLFATIMALSSYTEFKDSSLIVRLKNSDEQHFVEASMPMINALFDDAREKVVNLSVGALELFISVANAFQKVRNSGFESMDDVVKKLLLKSVDLNLRIRDAATNAIMCCIYCYHQSPHSIIDVIKMNLKGSNQKMIKSKLNILINCVKKYGIDEEELTHYGLSKQVNILCHRVMIGIAWIFCFISRTCASRRS